MTNHPLTVLAVAEYYAPGFKGGGPIRSLTNLIEHLSGDIRFVVVTRDRDLGDRASYFANSGTAWSAVNGTAVLYVAPDRLHLLAWCRLLRQIPHSMIYLNSLFGQPSRLTLWGRRLGLLPACPIVVAPRGELSPGALSLKAHKKRTYLFISRMAAVHQSVHWHASTAMERDEIAARIGANLLPGRIHIAMDLAPSIPDTTADRPKRVGHARLAFVSRISRMKNLAFALSVLATSTSNVHLDIYGPIEDERYWASCSTLLARMPANVRVEYVGVVPPESVIPTLSEYHALLLPTLGENFGHVIVESLAAGCLPLISDRTPWLGLRDRRAGWDLPLQEERFREAIDELVAMDESTFRAWSHRAVDIARQAAREADGVAAHRSMFVSAMREPELTPLS